MLKSKHCSRCESRYRKVLWFIRPKRKLCHSCFEYVMEHEDVNLDNVIRLSDRDEDFGELRENGRRTGNTAATAKAI
jgi:hypothetical protein